MESDWKTLEGKKVHLILRNDFEYNCIINSVDIVGNGLIYLWITDKFGDKKIIASGEIKLLEVKDG